MKILKGNGMSTAETKGKKPIKKKAAVKNRQKPYAVKDSAGMAHETAMPSYAPIIDKVSVDNKFIHVGLKDGRNIEVPISWFSRLANAKPAQRQRFHSNGIHIFWDEIDEIIGIKNILGPGATIY